MMIEETDRYRQARAELPPDVQRVLANKIALLVRNPAHRSLRRHRIKRQQRRIWAIYVTLHYRLLYTQQGGLLTLLDVGNHVVIDRVHVRNF
jgi:mRNA-degrading endonuclease YafQ of YafQ-DinJ toxin-antitoxin module